MRDLFLERSAMSSLGIDAYLKYGDHLIHVAAVPIDGAWLSWVEFTRDTPYSDGCVQIPIYRHKVPGAFESNPACLEGGIAYAARLIATEAVECQHSLPSSGTHKASVHQSKKR